MRFSPLALLSLCANAAAFATFGIRKAPPYNSIMALSSSNSPQRSDKQGIAAADVKPTAAVEQSPLFQPKSPTVREQSSLDQKAKEVPPPQDDDISPPPAKADSSRTQTVPAIPTEPSTINVSKHVGSGVPSLFEQMNQVSASRRRMSINPIQKVESPKPRAVNGAFESTVSDVSPLSVSVDGKTPEPAESNKKPSAQDVSTTEPSSKGPNASDVETKPAVTGVNKENSDTTKPKENTSPKGINGENKAPTTIGDATKPNASPSPTSTINGEKSATAISSGNTATPSSLPNVSSSTVKAKESNTDAEKPRAPREGEAGTSTGAPSTTAAPGPAASSGTTSIANPVTSPAAKKTSRTISASSAGVPSLFEQMNQAQSSRRRRPLSMERVESKPAVPAETVSSSRLPSEKIQSASVDVSSSVGRSPTAPSGSVGVTNAKPAEASKSVARSPERSASTSTQATSTPASTAKSDRTVDTKSAVGAKASLNDVKPVKPSTPASAVKSDERLKTRAVVDEKSGSDEKLTTAATPVSAGKSDGKVEMKPAIGSRSATSAKPRTTSVGGKLETKPPVVAESVTDAMPKATPSSADNSDGKVEAKPVMEERASVNDVKSASETNTPTSTDPATKSDEKNASKSSVNLEALNTISTAKTSATTPTAASRAKSNPPVGTVKSIPTKSTGSSTPQVPSDQSPIAKQTEPGEKKAASNTGTDEPRTRIVRSIVGRTLTPLERKYASDQAASKGSTPIKLVRLDVTGKTVSKKTSSDQENRKPSVRTLTPQEMKYASETATAERKGDVASETTSAAKTALADGQDASLTRAREAFQRSLLSARLTLEKASTPGMAAKGGQDASHSPSGETFQRSLLAARLSLERKLRRASETSSSAKEEESKPDSSAFSEHSIPVDNMPASSAQIGVKPTASSNVLFFAEPMEPRVNQEIESTRESLMTEQRIEELENAIRMAQKDLEFKDQELKYAQSVWEEEKADYLDVVGEQTNLISGIEGSEEAMRVKAKIQQDSLEKEINRIQETLARAEEELKVERDAKVGIKTLQESFNDQLAAEQAIFEKEKEMIGKQIRHQKDRINKIESQFVGERERFQKEHSVLQEQIASESAKLQKLLANLNQELARFEQEREDLRQLLKDQSQRLMEATMKLTKEKSQFQSDRSSLEKAFQQEKEKLERLVSFREKEHARFEEAKNELEMTIVYEKIKLKNLSSQLEQQDLAFRNKIKALEEGIAVEKASIANVEAQLEQEQAHTNELSTLRDELAKEKNLWRSERKALSRKTRETKSMLKSRLQEVKEKAKEEQKSLPEKYETQILDAKNSVTKLELDLKEAQKSSEELKATLEEMNREKNLLFTEREGAEARYNRTLDHRDGTIAELRSELETLYDDIYEREQKIEKYEESFDELFALAMQIAKRRMDEVFGVN